MALGPMVLGNPAGLFALLLIPVLLAIHLLQQKAHPLRTSTLFLLERAAPTASTGRRIDRLRNSLPLWLQLLILLVGTWILVAPHFMLSHSSQRVVVVLDRSASMGVYREALARALPPVLVELERAADRTEWMLVDADVERGTLYAGSERAKLAEVALSSKATGNRVSPAAAISVARTLVRDNGTVLLVTDHPYDEPGVMVLSVGTPVDNVGFTGVRIERSIWSAMVKNHGETTQSRELWIEVDGQAIDRRRIELEADQVQTVSGDLPIDADMLRVRITSDAFPLDDVLPIVRPRPKHLRHYADPAAQQLELVQRMVASLEDSTIVTEPAGADLLLVTSPVQSDQPSVLLKLTERPSQKNELAAVLAAPGPLTERLSFSGLIRRSGPGGVEPMPGDAVLLWQKGRPLVIERKAQLVVDFDVRHSNVDRLPSFLVMLRRFGERVRSRKVAREARNVETRQPLFIALASGDDPVQLRPEGESPQTLTRAQAERLRAPAAPGFFFLQQGDQLLFTGAARYGDLREADLSGAAAAQPDLSAVTKRALRNSRPDPLRPIWLLGIGALLLLVWWHRQRRLA